MTRIQVLLAAAALSIALLAAPAGAEAAKLKVGGGSVAVTGAGNAPIRLTNPNRSTAKGTLTLNSGGQSIGSKSFAIPGRRSKTVSVPLSVAAFKALEQRGSIGAVASAKTKGKVKGTATKSITLALAGGAPSGGGPVGGGGAGSPGGGAAPPAPAWQDGRYQGTWAENNTNLAFNITGTRLYTGPFDAFYISANCHNVDPNYTGPNQNYTDATAIEPVAATIGPDGNFSGSGTYQTGSIAIPWTVSGHVAGGSLTGGRFSVNYTDNYGNPCSGVANFVAQFYGAYTL